MLHTNVRGASACGSWSPRAPRKAESAHCPLLLRGRTPWKMATLTTTRRQPPRSVKTRLPSSPSTTSTDLELDSNPLNHAAQMWLRAAPLCMAELAAVVCLCQGLHDGEVERVAEPMQKGQREGSPRSSTPAPVAKAKKAPAAVKTTIVKKKRLPKTLKCSETNQPCGRPPHMGRGASRMQCIWDRQAACWRDANTGAKRRQ